MAGWPADEGRTRAPLHPYVSTLAAETVAESSALRWFHVDGTVVCLDISGFSSLAERLARRGRDGAEHVNDVLNEVFGGLIAEVHDHGGDVLEFGGDAMVVMFSGAACEARAVRATARMLRHVDAIRPLLPSGTVRVDISCGLASGAQAFHLVGERRRALMTVGDVSSRMVRLQSVASAGQALLDDATAAALPAGWTRRGPRPGTWRLRVGATAAAPSPPGMVALGRADVPGTDLLLPGELRELTDVGRRTGELKLVAVAFVLLDDTDGPGPDVHARLRAVTDVVEAAAAEHGTCWLETQVGDGAARWTLVAGAPVATERDPEHLVRALHAIAVNAPEQLRIGANLGNVFVGDMGHPTRCTFIAMGDATNVAARLMSSAQPGQVLVGERLARAGAAGFAITSVEPLQVKGRRAPVAACLVGLPDAQRARHPAPDGPVLVGRDEELAALRAALAAGGVVHLVGEAGSGKSRLWHEAHVRTIGSRWHIARAEPDEMAAPYAALGRLLHESAAGDDKAAALVGLAMREAPAQLPWLPLVAGAIGVAMEPTPEVERLAPDFRVERLRSAMAGVIAGLVGDRGVLVVDDAQWLDEPSHSVLAVVGRTLRPGAALLLARRPGSAVTAADALVELTPLPPDAAERLILAELPARLASDATLARLRAAADGNPLFLLELARRAAQDGNDGAAQDGLPESVQRLLAARVDALPPDGRRLIRDLAVLGARVHLPLAARVLHRPDLARGDDWAADLGDLGDLVTVDGSTLSFRHDLVRAAAYEGSSVRRRRDVHRSACNQLERQAVSVADTVAALAYHAVGSGDAVLVARWCQQAADSALERGAIEVAEQLLRDVAAAERALDAPPDRRRTTLQRLAAAAERAGDLDVAASALRDASRLADASLRPAIAVDRARVLEKLGRYRSALFLTARALRDEPSDDVRARLLLARATIRSFLGDWAGSLRLAAEVLAAAPGDDRLQAQAHLLSEWCCSCLGLAERAAHDEAALAGFTRAGDDIGLGNLHLNRGVSAWSDSRVEDAVADFRASAEHYRRAGDVVGAAMADNNSAEILTLQCRLDEAETLLQRARRVSVAADYRHGELTTVSGLSRVAAWRGDLEQAARLQATALAGFVALASDDYILDSLLRTAEIAVLRDTPGAALATLDDAAAALAKLGDVPVVPATLARLRGRALHDAGRTQEALVALDEAAHRASADGFTYEQALVTVLRGRLRGDPGEAHAGRELLATLGVVGIPPVC